MNVHTPANPGFARTVVPSAATVAELCGLATALPPYKLPQDEVARVATSVFQGRHRDFDRLRPVFENTGIEARYSVRPFEWFTTAKGWPERTEAYLEGGTELFIRAARAALANAGVDAESVDAVVTVSSTGIATPSLEARAAEALGLRPDVQRVPVFGLGCAGGVTGLALAARLARAEPGSTVLVVAVELCTLAFRMDEMTKANLIATALFGDGAAAAVVTSRPALSGATQGSGSSGAGQRLLLGPGGEHTWDNTLDVMGWRVDPIGFSAIFSKKIPELVHDRMESACDDFLKRHGVAREDFTNMIFHPGGTRVLEAYMDAFGLNEADLEAERSVLRECGNMSAPTVLFVLERKRRAGTITGPGIVAALGPGFTASFLIIDTCDAATDAA